MFQCLVSDLQQVLIASSSVHCSFDPVQCDVWYSSIKLLIL